MKRNLYSIVSVFGTIQGEGGLAGTPAVFVRLGGCNMWSGIESRREADAERNGAECPKWCATDFRPRERLYASDIGDRVEAIGDRPLIVITGGEPLLQLDDELLDHLLNRFQRSRVQVETNGTVEPAFGFRPRLYITLSPKRPRAQTLLTNADELKLVWPAYDPKEWETYPARARFLQPQAAQDQRDTDNEKALVAYLAEHPDWRLSLQTHKILGIE